MSWSEFYLIVSGLITLVIMAVVFPWLRGKNHAKVDSLNNTQIVTQRLGELDREVKEGLISERDKRQAVDELKLALVDETAFEKTKTGSALLPLSVGGLLAVLVGTVVYINVNQLPQVQKATDAVSALPELSQQLANGNATNLSSQDIANLALAIRQRLRQAPDDDTGWMYYGRLMLSLGEEVQAIEAIDRAVTLAPEKDANRITLAQALLSTGEVNNLSRSQGILADLLAANPQNDNLALMMTVVSAQLGDLTNTQRYYAQVKDKLPTDSDMAQRLANRIAQLEAQANALITPSELSTDNSVQQKSEKTGYSITISLADSARDSIPENGFLIVFAQDANSENRMPAAVVKLPLDRFPLTVSLTSENAMLAQYSLSNLDKVKLTARISEDENVATKAGEWEGSTTANVVSQQVQKVNIIINKELE
jgi:cytochrome c-type biogenesis protein CcmI